MVMWKAKLQCLQEGVICCGEEVGVGVCGGR